MSEQTPNGLAQYQISAGPAVSSWQQGATAARAGRPCNTNPHSPLTYDFVTWLNGWAVAAHNKAKEDDEL